MKILISAYACETGRGGEGEIAWRMVQHLAARHDVWVITRANLRTAHEAAFAQEGKPVRLHFIYFDLPWAFRFYKRGKRFFLLYYYLWQVGVGLLARRLMKAGAFDLSHHLTGGMDWMPSGLALCRGPFLWGPVGSENTHPVMLRKLGPASRSKDALRLLARGLMRHADPLVRLSGRKARMVLSHTPETMPARLAGKLQSFTQTGIEDIGALARPKTDLARNGALRIMYAGELKDWKGALLALEASLKYFDRDPDATLTIAGDGPLRRKMEAIIAMHRHGRRVRMTGRLPMEEILRLMEESDVFLYPSFHHGLATVVLQAMLTGVPIVCLEGDATGRAVRQEAGITVALDMQHQPAADLADAVEALGRDEHRRRALAGAAQRMAREQYSYAALAGQLEQAYRQIRNSQ
jgi:glycosyltransferase involved in cell wall biosynthesis